MILFYFILFQLVLLLLTNNVCYINIVDIDSTEFFRDAVASSNFTFASFQSLNISDFNLTLNDLNLTECDISSNDSNIVILFDEEGVVEYAKLFDLFGFSNSSSGISTFVELLTKNHVKTGDLLRVIYNMLGNEPDESQLIDLGIISVDNSSFLKTVYTYKSVVDVFAKLIFNTMNVLNMTTNVLDTPTYSYGTENMPKNWVVKINIMKVDLETISVNNSLWPDKDDIQPYTLFEATWDLIGESIFGLYSFDQYGYRAPTLMDIIGGIYNKTSSDENYLSKWWDKALKEIAIKKQPLQQSIFDIIGSTVVGVLNSEKFQQLKATSPFLQGTWNFKLSAHAAQVYFSNYYLRQLSSAKDRYELSDLSLKAFDHFKFANELYSGQYFNSPGVSNQKMILLLHKTYSLPPYGSTQVRTFSLLDIFTMAFWDPNQAFFTGFNSTDRRLIRPFYADLTYAVPIFIPVAGDIISLAFWIGKYGLRSNFTLEMFPELRNQNDPPDESKCLPAPPKLPDPRLGCQLPIIELMPSQFKNDEFTQFLTNITAYDLWIIDIFHGPLPIIDGIKRQLEIIPQMVLTPLLGPLVATSPNLQALFVFTDPIFKFINNATGEQGSDALPKFMVQINWPRFFLMAVLFLIFLIILKDLIIMTWFFLGDVMAILQPNGTIGGIELSTLQTEPLKVQMLTILTAYIFKNNKIKHLK